VSISSLLLPPKADILEDIVPSKSLQAADFESLRAIAAALNERGIPAARGGSWSAMQVARLLDAADMPRPFVIEGASVAG